MHESLNSPREFLLGQLKIFLLLSNHCKSSADDVSNYPKAWRAKPYQLRREHCLQTSTFSYKQNNLEPGVVFQTNSRLVPGLLVWTTLLLAICLLRHNVLVCFLLICIYSWRYQSVTVRKSRMKEFETVGHIKSMPKREQRMNACLLCSFLYPCSLGSTSLGNGATHSDWVFPYLLM